MTEQSLFERPIQTIPAIAEKYHISRFTLVQAAQRGDFGEDAYRSAATWLIDTTGDQFQQWLTAHEQYVKGRKTQEQQSTEEPTD